MKTQKQMIEMRTGDHIQQLLREGEELRPPGGVQSGAAVPPHQELKWSRHLARLGRDPRMESELAGGKHLPSASEKTSA